MVPGSETREQPSRFFCHAELTTPSSKSLGQLAFKSLQGLRQLTDVAECETAELALRTFEHLAALALRRCFLRHRVPPVGVRVNQALLFLEPLITVAASLRKSGPRSLILQSYDSLVNT